MSDTITNINIKTKVRDLFKQKKQYKLIAHNDDSTVINLVVMIFVDIIGLDENTAISKTMEVHNEGSAVLLTGSKSKMEALAEKAMSTASNFGFSEFTLSVEQD